MLFGSCASELARNVAKFLSRRNPLASACEVLGSNRGTSAANCLQVAADAAAAAVEPSASAAASSSASVAGKNKQKKKLTKGEQAQALLSDEQKMVMQAALAGESLFFTGSAGTGQGRSGGCVCVCTSVY